MRINVYDEDCVCMSSYKKDKNISECEGQSLLEYSAVIVLVVIVFLGMGTYVRRGIQGLIKVTADQLGNQVNAEQTFDEDGHLITAITITRAQLDKERKEFLGMFNYIYNDRIETNEFSFLNAGFIERPPP